MSNTYLTNNPLGSTSPKDLYDNSSNFDDGMNGPAPSFQDRFRLRRLSWAGFEAQAEAAIRNIGWVFTTPLDYAAGIVISLPNQVFRNGTEYYRAGPTLTLPYTTTGVWGTEGPNFVSVGDAALRSQLASLSGAGMVGYKRAETGGVLRTVGSALGDHRSAMDFGAVGDLSADDTSKVQAALNSFGSVGGALFMPGRYLVSTLNVPDNVTIYGGGVLLLTGTSGDLITLNTSSKVIDMVISHAADPTGTSFFRMVGNRGKIASCTFSNHFSAIVIGTFSTLVVGCVVEDCNMFQPKVAAGAGAIFLQNFSNAIVKDCIITGVAYPGVQPDYGIRIHNGDTAFITDCNVTGVGYALYMDVPAALHCYALRISGCLFDSAGVRTGVTIVDSALLNPAGGIVDTLIANTWFGLSANGNGLQLTSNGSGFVDGITLTGCQFPQNGIAGLNVQSASVRNLVVTGGYASANGVYGVNFAAGVNEWQLNGMLIGNVGQRGPNARGLNIDTGSSNAYMYSGCIIRGNTIFNLFDGGAGPNKVTTPNIVD